MNFEYSNLRLGSCLNFLLRQLNLRSDMLYDEPNLEVEMRNGKPTEKRPVEQISHPILFAVELTQSWQICAEYLANVGL